MVSQQHDATNEVSDEPDPAALSFVGGFIGTVTGFKRGNVPGAVVGGVVGGTVGYLAGASSGGADPASDPGRAEPILIDVDDIDSDTATGEENAGDGGAETGESDPDDETQKDSDA